MERKKNRQNKKEQKKYSVQEVIKAWKSFKPKVPLSFTLASHAAARLKNGQ